MSTKNQRGNQRERKLNYIKDEDGNNMFIVTRLEDYTYLCNEYDIKNIEEVVMSDKLIVTCGKRLRDVKREEEEENDYYDDFK